MRIINKSHVHPPRRNVDETVYEENLEHAHARPGIKIPGDQDRSWRGWAAEVSGNLAVNFVTILVIAALLFGFRGLDQMLTEFGQHSGVLHK
jgi:hypothetical protein